MQVVRKIQGNKVYHHDCVVILNQLFELRERVISAGLLGSFKKKTGFLLGIWNELKLKVLLIYRFERFIIFNV